MHNKWPVAKYIAYFQSYTNTYAPVSYLKECFERFVNKDGVVAIALGTRPDCLPKDVLDYLQDLNKRIPVVVELGLQTIQFFDCFIENNKWMDLPSAECAAVV